MEIGVRSKFLNCGNKELVSELGVGGLHRNINTVTAIVVVQVNVCPYCIHASRSVQALKVLLHTLAERELARVSATGDSNQVLYRIRHEGIGCQEHTLGSTGSENAMLTDIKCRGDGLET